MYFATYMRSSQLNAYNISHHIWYKNDKSVKMLLEQIKTITMSIFLSFKYSVFYDFFSSILKRFLFIKYVYFSVSSNSIGVYQKISDLVNHKVFKRLHLGGLLLLHHSALLDKNLGKKTSFF